MIEYFTSREFIVSAIGSIIFIIAGLVLKKKGKDWGVYISLLGIASIVINILLRLTGVVSI